MSTSLIRRLAPYLAARFRQNERLINSASSSSVLHHATPSSSSSSSSVAEPIHMTENCVRRMKELEASEPTGDGKMLRLSVETGGCSGFQYVFNLDDRINSDDRVFERGGIKLLVDDISYGFVKGATVDYVEELIRSAFVCHDNHSGDMVRILRKRETLGYNVTENPSAVGGCSCKVSFMVKQ